VGGMAGFEGSRTPSLPPSIPRMGAGEEIEELPEAEFVLDDEGNLLDVTAVRTTPAKRSSVAGGGDAELGSDEAAREQVRREHEEGIRRSSQVRYCFLFSETFLVFGYKREMGIDTDLSFHRELMHTMTSTSHS